MGPHCAPEESRIYPWRLHRRGRYALVTPRYSNWMGNRHWWQYPHTVPYKRLVRIETQCKLDRTWQTARIIFSPSADSKPEYSFTLSGRVSVDRWPGACAIRSWANESVDRLTDSCDQSCYCRGSMGSRSKMLSNALAIRDFQRSASSPVTNRCHDR